MHWHGMNLPARMDGGPYQPIEPGATWRPTWAIDQPAATLWYHPHPHGNTAAHVHRGVAGMFIVDDDQAAALDLPGQLRRRRPPGDHPGPLLRQQQPVRRRRQRARRRTARQRHLPPLRRRHPSSGCGCVCSTPVPASFYELGFDDGRSFQVIGTDGGLLPSPVTLERLSLSPGERAEVVVTFEPGEDAVLRNLAADGALRRTRAMATTARSTCCSSAPPPSSTRHHRCPAGSPTSTASTPPTPSSPARSGSPEHRSTAKTWRRTASTPPSPPAPSRSGRSSPKPGSTTSTSTACNSRSSTSTVPHHPPTCEGGRTPSPPRQARPPDSSFRSAPTPIPTFRTCSTATNCATKTSG